jgi:hypothetical protein
MQTSRYYRDYAKRARRLMDTMDRRAILETLETLARGFDEIAGELEAGMVAISPPDQHQPSGWRDDRSRATERATRANWATRH